MTRILVTGANGQLGSELQHIAKEKGENNFIFTDIEELDITNLQQLDHFFEAGKFDCLINCAGYTAVDKAEEEPELAHLLNSKAVKYLAEVTKKQKALLVHISTDYVFDGTNHIPYTEADTEKPVSVYGKTKFLGEQHIFSSGTRALIIRTSWLYSSYGLNFVKTMHHLGRNKKEISVVFDQIGTPTYAADLAETILKIIPRYKRKEPSIFNYSNEGTASWYDFAIEIMKITGLDCHVTPVESHEFSVMAKRPFYSILNKRKIKEEFGIVIPYWKDSLKRCVEKISEQED